MKFSHIINATEINDAKKASYLHIAQPLTIRSMIIAQKMAEGIVDVELMAVKHRNEKVTLPAEFRWTADLEKYGWEHIEVLRDQNFRRPLPRLQDIITSLYNASDAEYFIYSNLDIGLYPHFYLIVKDLIEKGHDAFCINRRDLPKEYQGVLLDESRIELIYALDGSRHPGIDCFVFRREITPSLNLGNVFIGYPPVGQVLKCQIEKNSENFTWLWDERLTFHIGSDQPWLNRKDPFLKENRIQANGLYVDRFTTVPTKVGSELRQSLTKEQGGRLISLARRTITSKLDNPEKPVLKIPKKDIADQHFQKKLGTFVTLKINEKLRGCMGSLSPSETILQGIQKNAFMSAFKDPRFPPLSADEVERLKIEISILSNPEKLVYENDSVLLQKLRPHVDGIIIEKGRNHATFLPQVWQQFPKPEDFLANLCIKAGLQSDEWEKGKLHISVFQAQTFHEK